MTTIPGRRRAAACLPLLLSLSCAPKPILVGFAGSITGKNSDLGIDGREAVEMAVDEANAAGGIRGRRLRLEVRDDGGDPGLAARNQLELAKEGVVAVIGHSTSALTLPALAQEGAKGLVTIAATVSTPLLTGKDDDFFRVGSDSSVEVLQAAAYLRERLGARTIVGAYDSSNAAYAETWYRDLARRFTELGGKAAEPVPFSSGNIGSWEGIAAAVVASAPSFDAIAIAAGSADTALVAQRLRRRGVAAPILSSSWAETQETVQQGGEAVEGMLFSETFDVRSVSPAYLVFSKAFRERYGRDPTFSAAHHYEAALYLFKALELAGPRGRLREALLRIERMEGLQGEILFDRFGDATRKGVMLEIRNGAFRSAAGP